MLTCLIGRRLGAPADDHFALRNLSALLIGHLTRKYTKTAHTLKPRLARTCLKHFLDPTKPLGTHYGAIIGLQAIGGPEVVRSLILPNVKVYESVIRDEIEGNGPRKADAERVVEAILVALRTLEEEDGGLFHGMLTNGQGGRGGEESRGKLVETLGEIIGRRVLELGRPGLVRAVLEDQRLFRGS